ncbi:MAG: DUF72 domain-containing protein [Planctomycetota bacterium]
MSRRKDTPNQLGLFGPIEDEQPARPKLAAAEVPDDVRALGERLSRRIHLGTSSWAFAGWRGIVYAEDAPQRHLSRHGLGAYGQHPLLRTVGVDRTFYAPIPAEEFAGYAEQVPDDFRFLVKAWGEVTSPTLPGRTGLNPNHLDADCALDHCVAPAREGLGDKLGPMLFQFPPQGGAITRKPDAFADRLHGFFDALPKGPRYVVELRDEQLFTGRYVEALRAAGAQHGYVAHPRMPSLQRQREVAPIAGPTTVRWMLHQGFAYEQAKERYQPFDALVDQDPGTRQAIVDMAREAIALDVEMVVVVNNKAEGSSPLSVLELARAIVQASVDANDRSTSRS